MPMSATHITILQRLALDPAFQPLLGDPNAEEAVDPDSFQLSRFANLGAVGPDFLFALADFNGPLAHLQRLENFLVKVAGTFQCISDLVQTIDEAIQVLTDPLIDLADFVTGGLYTSIKSTFSLITSVFHEGLLVLAINPPPWGAGLNLLAFFEPARQKDQPRENWYWADYLHYVRTGQFAQKLLELSVSPEFDSPYSRAYALGYLTHYITDVVGHPYVNQVVQAPWRLYWQRHHLVENFIDAYVWPSWHVAVPAVGSEEPPLDLVSESQTDPTAGAPITFARLNDFIDIGSLTLDDPVDAAVQAVCDLINEGIGDVAAWVSGNDPIELESPTNPDFIAWTEMFERAMREVYPPSIRHPENLAGDGYPTTEDIGAAYGVFRLFLRIWSEENEVLEPQPPEAPEIPWDELADVVEAVDDAFASAFGALASLGSSFSIFDLLEAIGAFAVDLVEAVIEAADALFALIETSLEASTFLARYALYYVQRLLFDMYRALRQVVVLHAYTMPLADELQFDYGSFNTSSLWISPGNDVQGYYPIEEILSERDLVGSHYSPIVPPKDLTVEPVAESPLQRTAPYLSNSLPDDFIGSMSAAPGPDNMFDESNLLSAMDPTWLGNFGGALENCRAAFDQVIPALTSGAPFTLPPGFTLPDYNLDGDRGYGWPCWDVEPAVAIGAPDFGDAGHEAAVPEPLRPDDPRNAGGVSVDSVALIL